MTGPYWRPIVMSDPARPADALPLAGGTLWFREIERIERGGPRGSIEPASALPDDWRERLTSARAEVAGLSMDQPRVMGILNVTPDSFSDGGKHAGAGALAHARAMAAAGADLLDIGGESTRPGADTVPDEVELGRVLPMVRALTGEGFGPISVDTRKASVAKAAIEAGASLFNDVSALTYDPESMNVAAATEAAICLMHAAGDPKTMQDKPAYDDVLLDVFDYLSDRIAATEAAGVPRGRLVADPGIGFGKTLAHNLTILRGLSLFHGLGVPLLVGASRKRFIGTLSGQTDAAARGPGSVAVALDAARQGAQILRVHDVAETHQALTLWAALNGTPGPKALPGRLPTRQAEPIPAQNG